MSKLKYTGVSTSDLLDIYKLFVKSRAEYMSVVWHSSLTADQTQKIENVQKTSLKIILGSSYTDYPSGLANSGLETLAARRQARCLAFAKRCLQNDQTKHLFPLNPVDDQNVSNNIRNPEKYSVNFAHTVNYKNSAVPYCQRLLNYDHQQKEDKRREKERARQEGHGARGQEVLARREGN